MKKLLLALGLLTIPGMVHAVTTAQVNNVRISTGTLARQSGTAVIAGINASTATVSSGTFTNASVTTALISSTTISTYWMPPVYSSATIQIAYGTLAVSSATSSTSFVNTTLAATITPKFSTSRIKISVTGSIAENTTIQRVCYATIARGSTDLSAGSGFGRLGNGGLATALEAPFAATIIDSPATTSATTYNVQIKDSNSAGSCVWNATANGTSWIIAEEIR